MVELSGNIAFVIVLGGIIWEDFQHRSIHIGWLSAFMLLSLLLAVHQSSWSFVYPAIIFNCVFVAVQVLLLTLYFSIKNQKLIWIGNQYLGLGDLVFFLGLSLLLPTLDFIWFYTLSLFLVLISFLLFRLFKPIQTVPLAGGMALCLIPAHLFNWVGW